MTLGLLVGRFGDFVREYHAPPAQMPPEAPFPDALSHLREHVGHHLIPLALIARSDREFLDSEREVIVSHCLGVAKTSGLVFSGHEREVLDGYVTDFYPSLAQLEPALHRLNHAGHDEVISLLKAARGVILADGVTSAEETKLLEELEKDLQALAAVK